MRIKKDFLLRPVADTYVVVPVGKAIVDFDGMITLNKTGAMLWQLLEQGTTLEALADVLTAEYDISKETAMRDVLEFVATLDKVQCIER